MPYEGCAPFFADYFWRVEYVQFKLTFFCFGCNDDDVLIEMQTIPRRIWLDKSGKQLIQWPIANIEKLRYNPVKLNGKVIKEGSLLEVSGITAAQV